MPIEGVRVIEGTKYSIFYIETFSNGFKEIIRRQLQGIWSGFAIADSLPEFFSYKNTLKFFLERYNSKSVETKKGMIGELLSHLLLNNHFNELTSLSILKNKEEKSIKKGFDIIYCSNDNKLWYSEVKSGRSETGSEDSTSYNKTLLKRAKDDIGLKIAENRNSLWESALYDVEAMIKESEGKVKMAKLLSDDSPILNVNQRKNVILISALYHDLIDAIEEGSVSDFLAMTLAENIFDGVIIVSIQKKTFETIVNFLNEELTR